MGASQQNFAISGVFINTMGYLMIRLILAGGLKGIYIGGGNDLLGPSLRRRASLRSSEVGIYFVEFGSTYNILHIETNLL
jgi:hypothetical protein